MINTEQLEALAYDLHSVPCHPEGISANMRAVEALREIAATMRKGRLTDDAVDAIFSKHSTSINGWEYSGEVVELRGHNEYKIANAVADAAVLAALPELQQLDAANLEWHNKTDWMTGTYEAKELGKHRADVLRERIAELKAQRDELLRICYMRQRNTSVI